MLGFLKGKKGAGRDVERGPSGMLAGMVVILLVAAFFGAKALFTSPGSDRVAAAPVVTGAVVVATATPGPTQTPWIMVVTATASPTLAPTSTPVYVYQEVPIDRIVTVEVERRVTVVVDRAVSVDRFVTATPVPLPASAIEICWRVQGAKEIYVNGSGVVGSGCEVYGLSMGISEHLIRVLR